MNERAWLKTQLAHPNTVNNLSLHAKFLEQNEIFLLSFVSCLSLPLYWRIIHSPHVTKRGLGCDLLWLSIVFAQPLCV